MKYDDPYSDALRRKREAERQRDAAQAELAVANRALADFRDISRLVKDGILTQDQGWEALGKAALRGLGE